MTLFGWDRQDCECKLFCTCNIWWKYSFFSFILLYSYLEELTPVFFFQSRTLHNIENEGEKEFRRAGAPQLMFSLKQRRQSVTIFEGMTRIGCYKGLCAFHDFLFKKHK